MLYSIDLNQVVKSEYPAVVRLAAKTLQETPYMTAGDFLSSLKIADLEELIQMCYDITAKKDSGDSLDSICLLCEMVAQSEGVAVDKFDMQRVSNFIILLTLEDLARKNLIEFDRDKATLEVSMWDMSIAKIKE